MNRVTHTSALVLGLLAACSPAPETASQSNLPGSAVPRVQVEHPDLSGYWMGLRHEENEEIGPGTLVLRHTPNVANRNTGGVTIGEGLICAIYIFGGVTGLELLMGGAI